MNPWRQGGSYYGEGAWGDRREGDGGLTPTASGETALVSVVLINHAHEPWPVNPKDEDENEKNQSTTIAPLPYELLMPPSSMAQPIQYQLYPMPQYPMPPQPQSQEQSRQKRKFTTTQLILLIIGIFVFLETPPPIDLIGLGMIIYALKKYWSGKS
jgi:hypothetical protein